MNPWVQISVRVRITDRSTAKRKPQWNRAFRKWGGQSLAKPIDLNTIALSRWPSPQNDLEQILEKEHHRGACPSHAAMGMRQNET